MNKRMMMALFLIVGLVAMLPAQTPKPNVPVNMVYVPGGTYTMGDTAGGGESDEKPLHEVRVSAFLMGKYEVTQKEFEALMGFNPSEFKGENLPVESVTWYDAVAYCNELSKKEGKKQVYTISGVKKESTGNITSASVSVDWGANGYRLPTEAEWEYAAKGAVAKQSVAYAGSAKVNEVAWYGGNSGSKTHPVGEKKGNELGLFDMSGNVWEWCWDWYGSDYYGKSPAADPRGPSSGDSRVERGGSWIDDPVYLRSSVRINFVPSDRYIFLGFRVASAP